MLFYSIFAMRGDAKKTPENDNYINASLDGYSPDPISIPPRKDVNPKFETFLFERSDQNIKYIKERLKSVIGLCHKRELHIDIPYEADLMEKFFSLIGVKEVPKLEKPARMNYEINFESPSEEEFDTIISSWRKHVEEIDADNYWDDIGFKLVGHERVFWLNRFFMSNSFDLSVKRENEEMIKPESLMKEISERRAELLAGLII